HRRKGRERQGDEIHDADARAAEYGIPEILMKPDAKQMRGIKSLLPRSSARRPATCRGVAMIIAVVAVAGVTVVATEFAYNSRVDLQMATNQRDEIRAYYLARSGIGLSRLLLRFQKQMDSIQIPDLTSLAAKFIGGSQQGATRGATPPATGMTIQLWRMARIDCYMLRGMVKETPLGESRPIKRTNVAAFDTDF